MQIHKFVVIQYYIRHARVKVKSYNLTFLLAAQSWELRLLSVPAAYSVPSSYNKLKPQFSFVSFCPKHCLKSITYLVRKSTLVCTTHL